MNRKTRLRRVALLCVHFTRNLAFYRAISDLLSGQKEGDFWITMQGNCVDTAVLEWCKLFGERSGKHSWQKIADDPDTFRSQLLSELQINNRKWEDCWSKLRSYRNAFVAHLDSDETMHILNMSLPYSMVEFYYSFVTTSREEFDRSGLPSDLSIYYGESYAVAESQIKHLQSPHEE